MGTQAQIVSRVSPCGFRGLHECTAGVNLLGIHMLAGSRPPTLTCKKKRAPVVTLCYHSHRNGLVMHLISDRGIKVIKSLRGGGVGPISNKAPSE